MGGACRKPAGPKGSKLPEVAVGRRGAERLRDGQVWVFRGDVEQAPMGLAPGFVTVRDGRGRALATALYSPAGPLALRLWGPVGAPTGPQEVARRVEAALDLRRRLLPEADGLRLVHGEADQLPGLFVDRYGEGLVVQTAAAAAEALLPDLLACLQASLSPRLVVRRDDGSARDLESLPRIAQVLSGGPRTEVEYQEGSLRLEADLLRGHKTGAYLDQRDNHLLAGELARGRCLDLFSCEGGFGLQLARRAEHVRCVEQDQGSLERLRRNAARNALSAGVEAEAANAFDLLRALHEARARFDTVVVDPPALAKRSGPMESALSGYFELNRRALQVCKEGALLFTFSCSGRVTSELFLEVLRSAATACRKRVRVLRPLRAGPDHPGLLGLPEADYLKGLLLSIS